MGPQLTTARTRRYFDAHAADYDRQVADAERRLLGDQRGWATSRAHGRVLELAVGTGLNLPRYPDAVNHVRGIDLSEQMLERARARIAAHGLAGRVEVRQGDVEHLDLADGSVDCVVSTYSLCTVADPVAVLREARRVLVPGGRLVLVEHGPARTWWIRTVQRLINPFAKRWQADDLLRAPLPLVEAAGFTITEADQDGVGGLAHRVSAEAPR
jgi:ubiquinone/menaquinone biosynthesis C-methylase UbiE